DQPLDLATDVTVHPFVAAVFLGMAWANAVQTYAEEHPPGRESSEAKQTVIGSERRTVVAANGSRKSVVREKALKLASYGIGCGGGHCAYREYEAAIGIPDGERLASLAIAGPPPTLKVDRPQIIWRVDLDRRSQSSD